MYKELHCFYLKLRIDQQNRSGPEIKAWVISSLYTIDLWHKMGILRVISIISLFIFSSEAALLSGSCGYRARYLIHMWHQYSFDCLAGDSNLIRQMMLPLTTKSPLMVILEGNLSNLDTKYYKETTLIWRQEFSRLMRKERIWWL